MNRRDVLAGGAVAAAAVSEAHAAKDDLVDIKIEAWNQPPEMVAKRILRARLQDDESRQDFTKGMTRFLAKENGRPESQQNLVQHVAAKGHNLLDAGNLGMEEAFNLLIDNPAYAARTRLARSNFHLHWDAPRRSFYRDAAYYLGEMEKTDKAGPGSLELNPNLDIPDYARWEIHTMPGGYVGDPFAGWVYDFGHIAGTDEHRDHGRSIGYAQSARVPDDRKVDRILDIGCGFGGSTRAFKERFPKAEVWGIDVGGPMVRYAHYRAVRSDLAIHFAQRDIEKTGFPDNHFDLAGDLIVFHEIEPPRYEAILREIHRILRPGGVFHHVDILTEGHDTPQRTPTIAGRASEWINHRHNCEPWWPPFQQTDFPALARKVGFKLELDGKATGYTRAQNNFPPFAAIKV